MFKVRNLRPELRASLMKSTDHTWLAATATGSGWRTVLRFRPRLRRNEQLLLHVQPVHPLVVHLPAFALQQYLQTAVAEPASRLCQLPQPQAQWLVRAPALLIATRSTIQIHQPTSASLAQLYLHLHHQHRLSPRLRAHHFFATTAFSARISTACSATMCFSCRFSSSSCL